MANGPLWFHQEFVDTIERFGEFRAFIVTEPDPKALRGRKGKIVCIAHTTWRTKEGAEMHVELVDDRMFNSFILWSHIFMPLRIILSGPLFESRK